MNLKSIISRAIDDVSYKTTSGMVNLNDTYHLHMVQEELKKHIDPNVVNMLFEADDSPKELSDADKEKIKKEKLKFIQGSQPPSWSKDGKLPAVYVNDNGKLSAPESDDNETDKKQQMSFKKSSDVEEPQTPRNTDYDPANKNWEPQDNNQKKSVQKTADKLRSIVGQLPVDENEGEAVVRVIDAIEKGTDPDPKDVEVFNKFIRIKETSGQSNPEFAFYVANSVPGEFHQGRRLKVKLGTGQNGHMVRRKLEAQGIQAASASTTAGKVPPKLSGKVMTMTKIASGKGGGVVKHKVKKKRDKDGKISEVIVGNRKLKRIAIPDNETMIQEVVDKLLEIKAANPGISDKDAKRMAKKRIATIKRNNAMIDQYENIDEVEEARLVKDADSSTPEGRQKIAKEGPAVMADSIQEHMEKVGPLTKD